MSSSLEKNCFGTQEGGTYSTDENIITLLPFLGGFDFSFSLSLTFYQRVFALVVLGFFALHIHYIWLFLSNPCGVIIIIFVLCVAFLVWPLEVKKKKKTKTHSRPLNVSSSSTPCNAALVRFFLAAHSLSVLFPTDWIYANKGDTF